MRGPRDVNKSALFIKKSYRTPIWLCLALSLFFATYAISQTDFHNTTLSVDSRIEDLLQKLTLEEKISMLGFRSAAVNRLQIPAYNWWNEGLHGVARAGRATVFPQAIAMAASFDDKLLFDVATAISTEARAKYNLAIAKNQRNQYQGLTFWSPNINIFRDPRWGRGQETYGEDPYLTSRMGVAFIKGIQGNNPDQLKAAACAKHFAVHSGPEQSRHEFNAIVDEKDLRETYLYSFKKLSDAGVEAMMCAYNRINGEPCCTSNTLLKKILREEWKFKGHVVTDCWALEDAWSRHKVYQNSVDAAAAAIKAGVNLDCSNLIQDDALKALQQNKLSKEDIDIALKPILATQIKLGIFDKIDSSPYANYGKDSIENDFHAQLSRKIARSSMVLLKNNNRTLPLDPSQLRSIMVVGPNAASLDALLGNYHGVSTKAVNFVEGITAGVDAATRVEYDMGCNQDDTTHFGGIWAAGNCDATVAVIGMTPVYEGEEGDAFLSGGDKKDLALPAGHIAYIKALKKANIKPLIAVITGGSAFDLSSIEPFVDAIIWAWYPGAQGGNALADILFGSYSPSGKLPITFYKSIHDLPKFDDYRMQGRTYRYFNDAVQYPFGYGLSYTNYDYKWVQKPIINGKKISCSVEISNTGNFDSDEVIQAYIQYPDVDRMPLKELKGFTKISLAKGKSSIVTFDIPIDECTKWDLNEKCWKLYPGDYRIFIGRDSADESLSERIKL